MRRIARRELQRGTATHDSCIRLMAGPGMRGTPSTPRAAGGEPKIGGVDAILTTIGVVAVVGVAGAAYAAFLLLRGRK
ncbi:hypothetical protein NS14008_32075 [Nocardia seriolae]|nr:hypothetical protein NS14008_32075 [Nocardia seriolae]PSK27680.1 hypothetical protein C6575_30590 [Nocardia seriolae]